MSNVRAHQLIAKKKGYDRGITVPASNILEAYLVGGQSNADGRVPGPCPLADGSSVLQGLQFFSTAYVFSDWQYNVNPITTLWAFDAIALKQYRDYKNKTIYAVKHTLGGTSMSPTAASAGNWAIPFDNSVTPSQSQIMKDRIYMAFHVAQLAGKQLVFKGILWHQGEGDYLSPDDAAYKARMVTLIANMRSWCRNTSLPFFFGSISTTSAQYNATVEASQRQIAVEVPNCYIVDMSAGTLLDSFHFDAASTTYFGNEVFNLMKTVIG